MPWCRRSIPPGPPSRFAPLQQGSAHQEGADDPAKGDQKHDWGSYKIIPASGIPDQNHQIAECMYKIKE